MATYAIIRLFSVLYAFGQSHASLKFLLISVLDLNSQFPLFRFFFQNWYSDPNTSQDHGCDPFTLSCQWKFYLHFVRSKQHVRLSVDYVNKPPKANSNLTNIQQFRLDEHISWINRTVTVCFEKLVVFLVVVVIVVVVVVFYWHSRVKCLLLNLSWHLCGYECRFEKIDEQRASQILKQKISFPKWRNSQYTRLTWVNKTKCRRMSTLTSVRGVIITSGVYECS